MGWVHKQLGQKSQVTNLSGYLFIPRFYFLSCYEYNRGTDIQCNVISGRQMANSIDSNAFRGNPNPHSIYLSIWGYRLSRQRLKNEGVISLPVEKSLLSLNKVPSSVWMRVHQQLLQSGWFQICTSMRLSVHILIQGYEIRRKPLFCALRLTSILKKIKAGKRTSAR